MLGIAEPDAIGISRFVAPGHGLYLYKRRPRVDLDIACHEQPGYPTRKRSSDRHLHLHGFDDSEQVACLDVIAWSYGKRDHDGRRRRSDNASFPVCHTVRDALDLHIIV